MTVTPVTAHRWPFAAPLITALARLVLRRLLRLSLVARPPPTASARSCPPARSCATSNSSVARPPARPPWPPARLRPSIHLARGRQSEHTTTSLPLTPPTMHSPSTLAGKAHGTPNLGWKCRRHGLVAPSAAGQRHAAQNLRDQLATSVPRIHPRFCPIPAPGRYRERAASRAKFAPFPTSSSRPNT